MTLLIFIIILGILVLAHEFGHFWTARKMGIKVDEFGFGFPPRIFYRKIKGTIYSLNFFPIGGFVKIFGEHGEGEGEKESFISRPPWQRASVIAAGVLMNLVLAWFFFSLGSVVGVPAVKIGEEEDIRHPFVTIVGIAPGSPAAQNDFRFGDTIIEMRAPDFYKKISTPEDVQKFVAAYREEEIVVTLKRSQNILQKNIIPRALYPQGEGPLGVALAVVGIKRVPLYAAPVEGIKAVGHALEGTAAGIAALVGDLFSRGGVPAGVSGPVGIFTFVGEARTLGFSYLVQLIALLSVNLAVLNILPFPALDGGRIFFLAIEKVFRLRLSQKTENAAHAIGFLILIALMIVVTYRDIVKIL